MRNFFGYHIIFFQEHMNHVLSVVSVSLFSSKTLPLEVLLPNLETVNAIAQHVYLYKNSCEQIKF